MSWEYMAFSGTAGRNEDGKFRYLPVDEVIRALNIYGREPDDSPNSWELCGVCGAMFYLKRYKSEGSRNEPAEQPYSPEYINQCLPRNWGADLAAAVAPVVPPRENERRSTGGDAGPYGPGPWYQEELRSTLQAIARTGSAELEGGGSSGGGAEPPGVYSWLPRPPVGPEE